MRCLPPGPRRHESPSPPNSSCEPCGRLDADGDPAEVKVLLVNYPSANETARFGLIKQPCGIPDDKGLPVLCRIVRFERSTLVSKHAAVAVLEQKPAADTWQYRERAIREGIGPAPAPAPVAEDRIRVASRSYGGHRGLANAGPGRGPDACR